MNPLFVSHSPCTAQPRQSGDASPQHSVHVRTHLRPAAVPQAPLRLSTSQFGAESTQCGLLSKPEGQRSVAGAMPQWSR